MPINMIHSLSVTTGWHRRRLLIRLSLTLTPGAQLHESHAVKAFKLTPVRSRNITQLLLGIVGCKRIQENSILQCHIGAYLNDLTLYWWHLITNQSRNNVGHGRRLVKMACNVDSTHSCLLSHSYYVENLSMFFIYNCLAPLIDVLSIVIFNKCITSSIRTGNYYIYRYSWYICEISCITWSKNYRWSKQQRSYIVCRGNN